MLDPLLRPLKDRVLDGAAYFVGDVSPTVLTAVGLAVGIGASVCAWFGHATIALVLWGANRVIDGLDGAVARRQRTASDLGGYLDLVADFTVYALLTIGIAVGTAMPRVSTELLGFLLATFYVNAVSWLALSAILERRGHGATTLSSRTTTLFMPPGVIEGTETIVFFAVCLVVPSGNAICYAIMAVLVSVTACQRVWWAWRYL